MGASIHIKTAMAAKRISQKSLAKMYGMNIQSFYNKIYRDTMTFSDVEQIADLLDCEVVLRDRKTGQYF